MDSVGNCLVRERHDGQVENSQVFPLTACEKAATTSAPLVDALNGAMMRILEVNWVTRKMKCVYKIKICMVQVSVRE
jgi:hypothetical protein